MLMMCSKKTCGYVKEGKFCSICGTKTIPFYMTCPYCKKMVSIKSSFCDECGKPVQEEINTFVENNRKEVQREQEVGNSIK